MTASTGKFRVGLIQMRAGRDAGRPISTPPPS